MNSSYGRVAFKRRRSRPRRPARIDAEDSINLAIDYQARRAVPRLRSWIAGIVDARLPLHDLVAARVDGAEAAARRSRREYGCRRMPHEHSIVPQFSALVGKRLPERLDRLQRRDGLRSCTPVHPSRIGEPSATTSRTLCWVCRGDCAAQHAAQAVPDDRHALAGFARDLFHPPSHQLHLAPRASDVEIDSRQIRLVSDAPEPSRESCRATSRRR